MSISESGFMVCFTLTTDLQRNNNGFYTICLLVPFSRNSDEATRGNNFSHSTHFHSSYVLYTRYHLNKYNIYTYSWVFYLFRCSFYTSDTSLLNQSLLKTFYDWVQLTFGKVVKMFRIYFLVEHIGMVEDLKCLYAKMHRKKHGFFVCIWLAWLAILYSNVYCFESIWNITVSVHCTLVRGIVSYIKTASIFIRIWHRWMKGTNIQYKSSKDFCL